MHWNHVQALPAHQRFEIAGPSSARPCLPQRNSSPDDVDDSVDWKLVEAPVDEDVGEEWRYLVGAAISSDSDCV